MLLFIERTWVVWWLLMVFATVRWFYASRVKLPADLDSSCDEYEFPGPVLTVPEEAPLPKTLFLAGTYEMLKRGPHPAGYRWERSPAIEYSNFVCLRDVVGQRASRMTWKD
jgi:hypothetical protein